MVKRIVGWFVLVPLCAALIAFALANRQLVVVYFNPFTAESAQVPTLSLPLYVVMFVLLLAGVLLGGTATWFAQGGHRRDERHYRRETERLHRELAVARREPDGKRSSDADDLVNTN